MIGNSPNTAPSSAPSTAWPNGMEYTAMAITSATSNEAIAASCALRLKPPSRMKSVSSGSAAKIAVSPSESPTGS